MSQIDKLVLLDLDRTIIDSSYQLGMHDSEFAERVKSAESQGIIVGLNSDSPAETLMMYAKKWRMNGPIICERGAFFMYGGKKVTVNKEACGFERLRHEFISMLSDQEPRDNLIVLGDVNGIAMSSREFGICSSKRAVLINGLRTHSLSFFVRSMRGRLEPNADEFDHVTQLLFNCMKSCTCIDYFDFDLNHEYGFCGVHHKATSKTNGVAALGPPRPFYNELNPCNLI